MFGYFSAENRPQDSQCQDGLDLRKSRQLKMPLPAAWLVIELIASKALNPGAAICAKTDYSGYV